MSNTPTANLKETQRMRISYAWIVPAVAIILSALLYIRWELNKGPAITIRFENANGLNVDSPIMFRGAIVGRVGKLYLLENNSKIVVQARLNKSASGLAVKGSQWWIVHPSVTFQGVSGLDTIISPRYIQVVPGDGAPETRFEGSPEPIPFAAANYTLISDTAEGIAIGTPIFYRGIEIGSITKVVLAQNAATARIHFSVQDQFIKIIRTNSKFWNVSGIRLDAGLTGITLHAGPLPSLIRGGITMATPTAIGDLAPKGYAFTLLDDFEEAWLDWTPEIDISDQAESK
ncbi:MAG: MCE family protein [Planctomycetes bacterium]|nr:MCE family protein [Planctomycetota bacterium]